MATMEPNQVCSAEYYEQRRPERILESRLGKEAVYAFFMRMEAGPIDALRVAAQAKLEYKAGSLAVKVTVFNNDMQPLLHNYGEMTEGIWTAAKYDPLRINIDDYHVERVVEAYFLDYNEGLDMPMMEQIEEIENSKHLAGQL